MSKIKGDKINFDNNDYIIEVNEPEKDKETLLVETFEEEFSKAEQMVEESPEEIAQMRAQEIIEEAQKEAEIKAQEIIKDAQNKADEILENAKKDASELAHQIQLEAEDASQKKAEDLINSTKESLEQERIKTINESYEEGYKDGNEKLLEELEEKIKFFDDFCSNQYKVEQNILKASAKEVLDIITNISKKVLNYEINGEILDKIIKKTVVLLEDKENINIILSEKYAKILYEFQQKSLTQDIEFDFKNFRQYDNFNISYSPEYKDDTIIVENVKERFDASINAQLDIIIRNIYEKTETQNLEIEEYKKINEIE